MTITHNTEINLSELKQLMISCENNIRSLLESAVILHPTHPQNAIPLTILAFEETYKLSKISNCIKNRKNMTKREWSKLTNYGSHGKKLTGFFVEALESFKKMEPSVYEQTAKQLNKVSALNYRESYENVISDEDYILNNLKKIQTIKLDSFYRGWDFEKNRITDITKTYNLHELHILSTYLFDLTQYFFREVLLNHKYLVSFHIQISKNINTMFNDPLWKASEEYFKKINEKNYSKITNIGKIMLETYPEKLPEKYTPKKPKNKESIKPEKK